MMIHYDCMMQMKNDHMNCDVLMSYNMTQKEHRRMRRSLADVSSKIWKGFHFYLETPSVDWQKHVGGSSLGASIDVIVRNLVDINIGKCWRM